MLADELGRRPVLARERLFDGRVWDVEAQEFELGGERIRREVIVHPGAVAVVALDDEERLVLVHQYRHPAGGTLWELPAGLLDVPGEDPLLAAQRELAEEADLEASDWSTLLDISTTGGGSTEIVRVYLATGLSPLPAYERTDEEAHMEVRRVPLAEVVEAALAMRLHNSVLLASALAVHALRLRAGDRGELRGHSVDVPFAWHDAHRT